MSTLIGFGLIAVGFGALTLSLAILSVLWTIRRGGRAWLRELGDLVTRLEQQTALAKVLIAQVQASKRSAPAVILPMRGRPS